MALIESGDTVMGMDLAAGGHLTTAPVSFSGQTYNFVSYSVDPETELLDFDAILKQAQEVKPKLIVAGASAILKLLIFQNSVKSQMLLGRSSWSIWPISLVWLRPVFTQAQCHMLISHNNDPQNPFVDHVVVYWQMMKI